MDKDTEILALVMSDLIKRGEVGKVLYGLPLTVGEPCHNGLSALQNAYEEALDQAMYLKKAILEWEMMLAMLEDGEAFIEAIGNPSSTEGDRGLKDLHGIWDADFSEEDIDRAQWRSPEQEADRG